MRPYRSIGLVASVLVACATADDEAVDPSPDASAAGSGGSGGACTTNINGAGGAVHIGAVVPTVGGWCPQDALEVCTDTAFGSGLAPDGGQANPSGVRSRCVGQAWQTVEGMSCQNQGSAECNILPAEELDGKCCTEVRNCAGAFCDGQRWWTRR